MDRDPRDDAASIARIDTALRVVVDRQRAAAPPRLMDALDYALFPGGARLRPRLVILAAEAHGDPAPSLTTAAAAAVEMMHCASLVHDDLPCFDDAPVRRGRPSLHCRFDVATALLVGDALIVMAFDTLASAADPNVPNADVRTNALIRALSKGSGVGGGLVAGQAWELEREVSLEAYHRAKTASLFEVAAASGAIAAGAVPEAWQAFGRSVGELYQLADDLADACGSSAALGKPVRRDLALHRPNAVQTWGLTEVRRRIAQKREDATRALASLPQGSAPRAWLDAAVDRLVRSVAPNQSTPGLGADSGPDEVVGRFVTRTG